MPTAEPEQQQVGQRADHPHRAEPDQLAQQPRRNSGGARGGQRLPAELGADLGERQDTGGQRATEPSHSAQVGKRGTDDVHPGIRVVHPVHRHLVDAQASALGQHQQFGVEEPARVAHQWQQRASDIGPHRLEPALRIGEPGKQGAVQDQVVAAGDQLPLGSADHPAVPGQPRPDGHVRMPRDQRGDQRQQRVQVGGQVHVHVGDHVGARGQPHRGQRTATALLLQPDVPDAGQLAAQPGCHQRGGIGAGVVGDGDQELVGKAALQMCVQPSHAGRQICFLVEDRDRHVQGQPIRVGLGVRWVLLCQRRHGANPEWRRLRILVASLCAAWEPRALCRSGRLFAPGGSYRRGGSGTRTGSGNWSHATSTSPGAGICQLPATRKGAVEANGGSSAATGNPSARPSGSTVTLTPVARTVLTLRNR